ncbi:MAG TPA: ATP-binding protein [Pyrinomonadaceae bacterium]|nr:ATP-binding protein [Pyrinomonadaceae bacterium]
MSRPVKLLLPVGCLILTILLAASTFNARVGLILIFSLIAGLLFGLSTRKLVSEREIPSEPKTFPEEKQAIDSSGLIQPEALLTATMKTMREGVLVVDREMRVIAANRAAREIFSRMNGALERARLSDITRNGSIHAAFQSALDENLRTEIKAETGQGTLELRVMPLLLENEERARFVVGIFFDMTDIERLERARREFLSNVSHELRTPLTAIRAFVETLEEGAVDEAERERFLSIISRNALRMHALIDDILELSSIESGAIKVEPSRVKLLPLVSDITISLAARAAERNVHLKNEIEPGAEVYADRQRLEQMLTNLIDNAIKFNREGGTVRVMHERGSERDLISIADTGEGVSQENLARVFERFYQVDRARSRERGGTGLGLSIVKHLARAHGGDVAAQSELGKGSTFTIELPVDSHA